MKPLAFRVKQQATKSAIIHRRVKLKKSTSCYAGPFYHINVEGADVRFVGCDCSPA